MSPRRFEPTLTESGRSRGCQTRAGRDLTELQTALLAWYAIRRRDLPWRQTADPYAILVSEIMLQQTQASRVAPKYLEFMAAFPSFQALAQASRGEVIRSWAPLGYNRRAVRLHELARRVVGERGGQLPSRPDQLREFDGLGAYTAAAVACFAFGQQVAVVDTNVRRVISRLRFGGAEPPPSDRVTSQVAAALLPSGRAQDWNQALMDLGAVVCTARAPDCPRCPVAAYCAARVNQVSGSLPRRAAEPRATYRADSYAGSSRYYRGRVVEFLRGLPAGRRAAIDELGAAVRADYEPAQRPWLARLLDGLEADGLVAQTRVSGGAGAAAEHFVSLP